MIMHIGLGRRAGVAIVALMMTVYAGVRTPRVVLNRLRVAPRVALESTVELNMVLSFEREKRYASEDSSSASKQTSHPRIRVPVVDRMFDQLFTPDDSESAPQDDARARQRICSRWIIYRCLQLHLSNTVVQQRTGLDAEQLRCLKIGITPSSPLTNDQQRRLSRLLADEHRSVDWVSGIVWGALGHAKEVGDATITQAIIDMSALDDDEDAELESGIVHL
jgi:hypothetical protein